MSIIAIIVTLEAILLILYIAYARVYFLLTIIFFFLYFVLKYYDGDEDTGGRAWRFLRRFTLFGKSVQYYFGNVKSFDADQPHDRMLFVVVGNLSNMGMLHAFGMHGGVFQHVDLVYMLPKPLFYVPILRDFLLWTGAVRQDEGVLLKLLKRGKSVAYCPSGMEDLLTYTNPRADDQLIIHAPNTPIFEFAMKHKIQVIPVLVAGETRRYVFYRSHWVNRMQTYAYERWKWPFPLLFFPRIFGHAPPPKIDVQIGYPMDASIQENVESFAKLFRGQFSGLVETGGDDRELIIKEWIWAGWKKLQFYYDIYPSSFTNKL